MNNWKVNGAVFIDLQKAFDMIDHKILLNKLNVYLGQGPTLPLPTLTSADSSINPCVLSSSTESNVPAFFHSYLSNRQQFVFVNGVSSAKGIVRRGVPQGSVLGPLLFCLFINDMPLHIKDSTIDCDLFADDATLHTSDKNINKINSRLQHGLEDVSNWCQMNSMVINPTKSECMVVTTRQKRQLKPLTLNLSLYNQSKDKTL